MRELTMRHRAAAVVWGVVAAACLATATLAAPPPEAPPGQLLVRLKAAAKASPSYQAGLGTSGRTGLPGLDRELAVIGAVRVQPLLRFPAQADSEPGRALNRTLVVRYAGSDEPAAAAARLAAAGEVERATPDGFLYLHEPSADPLYPQQWAHDNRGQVVAFDSTLVGTPDCDTDTDHAWDETTGAAAITIAIIDTGVDLGHPEFSGRVLAGYDFMNDDADPDDDNGHGTACAGVAAAAGANAQGIAGVAWQARIMPLKVLDADGHAYSHAPLVNGITWAADHGARVLSISIGASGPGTEVIEDAVAYAYGLDCAIFCSAGNYGSASLGPPAAYVNYTMAVGALSPCNERKTTTSCDGEDWWASNHVSNLFLAPGVRIATTDIRGAAGRGPDDYTTDFNGTSAACPHAAGIGALVLALNPALGPYELKHVLDLSSEDMGAHGVDDDTGWGRLNAMLAVLGAFTLPTYARAGYVGAEAGSLHQPWDSFANGIGYVPEGGTLILSGGTYDLTGPLTITKRVTIRGINGVAAVRP